MFKAIVTGDLHLSSSQVGSRLDDYPTTSLRKLTFVLTEAVKRKANAIIIPGDFFHHKEEPKIGRHLNIALAKFCRFARSKNIEIFAVIGNHDMAFHDPDISKRSLGLLLDDQPNFHLVCQKPETRTYDDLTVAFTGSHYVFHGDTGALADRTQYFPQPQKADFHIHITHGQLVPQLMYSDMPGMELTTIEELGGANPPYNLEVNGHIHWIGEENLLMKQHGRWFLNPGSLTRGSLKAENIKRGIFIYEVTVSKTPQGEVLPTFEKIEVPHQPADIIFDVNAYKEAKAHDKEIDAFIDALQASTFDDDSSNSSLERLIANSEVPEPVKSLAREFITKLDDSHL